jgi:hypothetical protein
MTFTKKSSTPLFASTSSDTNVDANVDLDIKKLAKEMNDRATSNTPFTSLELQELETSFANIMSNESNSNSNGNNDSNEEMLKSLLELCQNVGHLSHKDWTRTGQSASKLNDILLPPSLSSSETGEDGLTDEFRNMFARVIKEGNWDNAVSHANANTDKDGKNNKDNKPWAVLVTGVNGIRKTTSVYQSWFPQVLKEALIAPATSSSDGSSSQSQPSVESLALPTGNNSFFRQLDHMIASLSNYNFQLLYQLTSQSHDFSSTSSSSTPSKEIIQNYSNYKASIFTRYRTLSEILGVMLITKAQANNINVMIETSGRDVAMYHYIDTFFNQSGDDGDKYNKLVLHFDINDLGHAEDSVDRRMVSEMENGVKVLNGDVNVKDLINVNAGGPYGSEVLKGIQEDSNKVWETIIQNSSKANDDNDDENQVGHDWYKASIQINASSDKDWTARAIKPDGTLGTEFTFEAPRKV